MDQLNQNQQLLVFALGLSSLWSRKEPGEEATHRPQRARAPDLPVSELHPELESLLLHGSALGASSSAILHPPFLPSEKAVTFSHNKRANIIRLQKEKNTV